MLPVLRAAPQAVVVPLLVTEIRTPASARSRFCGPTRSHAAAAAGVRAPPGRPEPQLPPFPASRLCAPSALASEGDERAARLFIRNRDAVCPPRDTPASSCPRAPVLGTGLGAFPWTHVEQLAGDVRVVTAARPSSHPDDDF